MLGGWQCLNGVWYYMGLSERELGEMYSDRLTPDGYRVGEDGAWDGASGGDGNPPVTGPDAGVRDSKENIISSSRVDR